MFEFNNCCVTIAHIVMSMLKQYTVQHKMYIISSHYQPLIREGCGDVTALSPFSRDCRDYWSQSQLSLWAKAAHHRALTDGRGCHKRCQLHITSNLGFSILIKDNSTCCSAPHQGSQDSKPVDLPSVVFTIWAPKTVTTWEIQSKLSTLPLDWLI